MSVFAFSIGLLDINLWRALFFDDHDEGQVSG